jgi:DNA-binding NarL/FixJ family response regulator
VSTVRTIVVDDFEPFRRYLRSIVGSRPGLQVIDEASDGLEAVQKAEELKPDLILLDIGLPTLNGIQACQRISTLAPHARIVFVTQESDADVARECLANRPRAYVLKLDANSDLLHAVDAVLEGKQFVSTGLKHLTWANQPRQTFESADR